MKIKILVVDDEEIERVSIQAQLASEGYEVATCADAISALKVIRESNGEYDIILCDIKMPQMDGFAFLDETRAKYPLITIIMMTAYGSVDGAVKAMRRGAYDYLTKPFSTEELSIKLEHALKYRDQAKENIKLKEILRGKYRFHNLIGKSNAMREVFDKIQTVAPSDTTILIQGETGTGKELVTSAIHYNSSRKDNPFIKVSCAMLNSQLLESELFGHEAGAFTSAIKMKKGRFELAHKGTLFLDEVDDIPYEFQVKLLRVIEEKKFERVGGEKLIESDVRIIAASKFDLRELVNAGKFRNDLFYRLSVVNLNLPPLRIRKDDISLLVEHFLDKYNAGNKISDKTIQSEIMKYLVDYDWPGNVRELENVIEQMVSTNKTGKLELGDLPEFIIIPKLLELKEQNSVNFNQIVSKVEREIIEWALQKSGGNQTRAAEILGIPRTTLREKLNHIN